MTSSVIRDSLATLWATGGYKTSLNSSQTNTVQQITTSEARAGAFNDVGLLRRYTNEAEQVAPKFPSVTPRPCPT